MATRVERRIVCDFGDRHTGEVTQWRLSHGGEHKILELCPTCARPLVRIWDRGGEPKTTPQRMRIYDMQEIEAQKSRKAPSPK